MLRQLNASDVFVYSHNSSYSMLTRPHTCIYTRELIIDDTKKEEFHFLTQFNIAQRWRYAWNQCKVVERVGEGERGRERERHCNTLSSHPSVYQMYTSGGSGALGLSTDCLERSPLVVRSVVMSRKLGRRLGSLCQHAFITRATIWGHPRGRGMR